jgi:hypothetical protein
MRAEIPPDQGTRRAQIRCSLCYALVAELIQDESRRKSEPCYLSWRASAAPDVMAGTLGHPARIDVQPDPPLVVTRAPWSQLPDDLPAWCEHHGDLDLRRARLAAELKIARRRRRRMAVVLASTLAARPGG